MRTCPFTVSLSFISAAQCGNFKLYIISFCGHLHQTRSVTAIYNIFPKKYFPRPGAITWIVKIAVVVILCAPVKWSKLILFAYYKTMKTMLFFNEHLPTFISINSAANLVKTFLLFISPL